VIASDQNEEPGFVIRLTTGENIFGGMIMKKLLVLWMVLGAVFAAEAAVTGSILFSDSYDRPNNTDIDASSVGMAGLPMTYVEAFEGSGAASIQILSNQLNIAQGVGMSSLFLDHNFIDAAMLSADGFSVTMNVVSITSADDQANRFGGFGVGNTRAEAQAAADCYDSPATSLRPAVHLAGQGVSDFYVDLALDQNLRIWNNGTLLNTINVGAASGTLKVDFFVTDFLAGSEVEAVVYFNGVQQDAQTFTWDNTDNNYIGISGRTAGAGVFLDNLSIATIYEDRAYQPYPADGEMLVNAAGLALSWNKGKDGSGNPNAAIGQHYLYIAETEPNFATVSPVTVADTADPVTYSGYSFGNDKLYYWRVDESINGSVPADANTITGYVWSFDTFTFPIINTSPAQALVAATETAALSCDFTSVTEPTVSWFKEAGEIDVEVIAGGDVTIDVSNPSGSTYVSTLSIGNVDVSDEGAYYCLVENSSGGDNAVASAAGTLGVKRIVGHWTFDLADFQNGLYLDSSGEGHHAEPNVVPDLSQFVTGADAVKTSEGVDFTAEPLSVADAGDWAISTYTARMTVSMWVNWAGANGGWQGLVSNRTTTAEGNFYFEIRQDNGNFQLGAPYFASGALQGPNLPIGQWAHVAVTMEPAALVIYLNGQEVSRRSPVAALTSGVFPMLLGALGRSETGTLLNPFNGTFDDVRFYNYAKTAAEIVDLYYDISEVPVCLNLNNANLSFDVAGAGVDGDEPDCIVNLTDFAVFAQTWLNCGLYPQSDCQ
jgi:hypothetical protein